MNNQYPYRPGSRFQIPERAGQIVSPYDIDSNLLQDLAQRQLQVMDVITISLAVAGTQLINKPGYGFVFFGHDGDDIKTVNTQTLVNVWINQQTANTPVGYPAKHARGYFGPFGQLFLQWPAQTDAYVDLIIFKNFERPWIDGEACT